MAEERQFEHYDARIAEAMIQANETVGGFPRYLGARFLEFRPGVLIAELPVREEWITPVGAMHGGVMAGFIDHVLGCVLYPLMRPGQWAATTEFKLNYLSPVRGGTLRAESRVVALTRRTAVVQVEVRNEGTLAALAQGTLLVSEPPGKADKGKAA